MSVNVTPGMGGGGMGGGAAAVAVVPTVGGIAVLPNTGDNTALLVVSLLSTVVGSLILASTAVRFIAKKYYKA